MTKKSDNEYTFEGKAKNETEEYTAAAHSDSTENLKSILSNPKILLPVGLLILFYGGSKFFTKPIEVPKKEPEVIVDTPKPAEVKSIVVDPVKPAPVFDTALQSSVGSLKQSYESQQDKISRLEDSYGKLNYQMTGVNQQLHNITMQLDSIKDRLTKTQVMPKKVVKRVIKQKPSYFIKAIVDGRAWVRDLKNSTLTVAVGDSIPKYGAVTGIYPEEGFITTQSGRVVRFSSYAN